MVSFIVIGRNEGWKLNKCFQSILDTIEYNQLNKYEIIYVDSNSTDDSIERVKKYKSVKIFKLTGDLNPAIARNVGAQEARGDIFFFLDGDMEINKNAFLELFNNKRDLKFDFISGDFQNVYYKNKNTQDVEHKEMYHKNTIVTKNFTTGGLFVLKRDIWIKVNGMRDIFKKGEDGDLGLRLSKENIFLYRLPVRLVDHHTISYSSNNRFWGDLKDDTHLYGRSLLYRKNIFNVKTFELIVKQDYSFLILVLVVLSAFILKNPHILLIYLVVLILRSFTKNEIKYLFYFLIRDIKVLLGFFLFYPKKNKISYNLIE